jgi:hypothetical protein
VILRVWEIVCLSIGVAAAIVYGGYRYRLRDRNAPSQPPPDFEKPPNEGDLL